MSRSQEPGSSTAGGDGDGAAWQTKANSVTPQRGAETPELPSPEECVADLLAERPVLARTPLAGVGTKVRSEVVDELDAAPVGVYDQVFGGVPDPQRERMGMVVDDTEREIQTVTVAEAVYAFLRDYERHRGATVYLEKSTPGGEATDSAEVPAENSFAPQYRRRRHAQLKGFEREIVTEFTEPVVALAGLTASGVGPDGLPRPPADHMREIAEAWSKSGGVRETLRNRLESGLGLEPDEWAYIRGGEPHPGDGANAGFHHDHPAVVIDAAAVDGDGVAALRSAMEAAVETHVAECPMAGPAAHEDAIARVMRVDPDGGEGDDSVTQVGSYVGSYIGGGYGDEPPEESVSALVWQATAWAAPTQKFTAGRTARAMITADRCRSEAADGDHGPHGAKLRCTTDAWGRETVECAYCGSHHDVPDTHEEARRSRAVIHRGERLEEPGADLPDGLECGPGEWVARVGGESRVRWCGHGWGRDDECPLCASTVGAVAADVPIPPDAFDAALLVDRLDAVDPRRPEPAGPPEPVGCVGPEYGEPTWAAVELRTGDGETHEIGAPGSVEYRVVTDVPGETARRAAVGALAAECVGAGSGERGGDVSGPSGAVGPTAPAAPPDGRKAILDALRGEREPLSVATVAGRAGLAPDAATDYLSRMAETGRVRRDGDGWAVV